jgi:hypothetical protein
LLILDWRVGNLATPLRDPPFTRPDADVEESKEDEDGEHPHRPVAKTMPMYPHQSTYDNSNAMASPYADSNSNACTTRLSITADGKSVLADGCVDGAYVWDFHTENLLSIRNVSVYTASSTLFH